MAHFTFYSTSAKAGNVDRLLCIIGTETEMSKASQILGLIHRIFQYKDPTVLVSLYKSMVRPHLENCSVA